MHCGSIEDLVLGYRRLPSQVMRHWRELISVTCTRLLWVPGARCLRTSRAYCTAASLCVKNFSQRPRRRAEMSRRQSIVSAPYRLCPHARPLLRLYLRCASSVHLRSLTFTWPFSRLKIAARVLHNPLAFFHCRSSRHSQPHLEHLSCT